MTLKVEHKHDIRKLILDDLKETEALYPGVKFEAHLELNESLHLVITFVEINPA